MIGKVTYGEPLDSALARARGGTRDALLRLLEERNAQGIESFFRRLHDEARRLYDEAMSQRRSAKAGHAGKGNAADKRAKKAREEGMPPPVTTVEEVRGHYQRLRATTAERAIASMIAKRIGKSPRWVREIIRRHGIR